MRMISTPLMVSQVHTLECIEMIIRVIEKLSSVEIKYSRVDDAGVLGKEVRLGQAFYRGNRMIFGMMMLLCHGIMLAQGQLGSVHGVGLHVHR